MLKVGRGGLVPGFTGWGEEEEDDDGASAHEDVPIPSCCIKQVENCRKKPRMG